MARSIGMAREATVFRAVIEKRRPDGTGWTAYEGPYRAASAARARVTFWKNYYRHMDNGWSADGYVESGEVSWTKHPN